MEEKRITQTQLKKVQKYEHRNKRRRESQLRQLEAIVKMAVGANKVEIEVEVEEAINFEV